MTIHSYVERILSFSNIQFFLHFNHSIMLTMLAILQLAGAFIGNVIFVTELLKVLIKSNVDKHSSILNVLKKLRQLAVKNPLLVA